MKKKINLKFKNYKCFICNKNNSTKLNLKRKIFSHLFFLKMCNYCNSMYTNQIPSNNYTLKYIYKFDGVDKLDIKKNCNKFYNKILLKIRNISLNAIYNILYSHFKKSELTILDYACGSGYFSNFLSDKKADDITACDIQNKRPNNLIKEIEYISIKKINYKKKYDLIFLRHVIEHIPNPKKTLLFLKKILKKNGIIYLEFPNQDLKTNLFLKIFRSDYNQLCLPYHINHFTENSFKKMIKKNFYFKKYYFDIPVLGESLLNFFNIYNSGRFNILNILFFPFQIILTKIFRSPTCLIFLLKNKV